MLPDNGMTASEVLGVDPLAATLDDIRALRRINETAQLWKSLGTNKHIEPEGEFVGESHMSGLLWLMGSTFFHQVVMGGSDGVWAGTFFANQSKTSGGNIFVMPTDNGMLRITRNLPFAVNRGHFSEVDSSTRTTELDYSYTNHYLLSIFGMKDEIRCLSKDLCMGFRGFYVLGGPANGHPFVLYRANMTTTTTTGSKRDPGDWEEDEKREL